MLKIAIDADFQLRTAQAFAAIEREIGGQEYADIAKGLRFRRLGLRFFLLCYGHVPAS